MKLLAYKIISNISSWLGVTKKYNHMPLSNTLKGYQKHNSTRSQHGPFGLA